MTTTEDGSLLVGWSLGGVSLLKDGQFKDYGGSGSGFPEKAAVERFHKGGDGSVWALVNYWGVYRVDDGGHWHKIDSELSIPSNLTLLYCDRQGTLWVGTEKEIFALGRGEKKVSPDFGWRPGYGGIAQRVVVAEKSRIDSVHRSRRRWIQDIGRFARRGSR